MIKRLRVALWLAGVAAALDLCTVVPGLLGLLRYRTVQSPLFDYVSAVLFDGRRFLPMFFNMPLVWGAGLAGAAALLLARPALGRWRDSYTLLALVSLLLPVVNALPLVLLWIACLRSYSGVLAPVRVAAAKGGAPEGPIVPRIKTRAYLEAMAALPGMTAENMPVIGEIAGELIVTFAIDTGGSFITLTAQLCALRGLEVDAVLQLAMNNALPALHTLQLKEEEPVFHIHGAEGSNDLEACVLLDSTIWDAVALRLQDAPVAIVPRSNAVHCTAAGSAEGLAALRQILAQTDFSERGALSRELYIWKDRQWSVFAVSR